MKPIITLLLFFSMTFYAYAQQIIPLWPEKVPNSKESDLSEEVLTTDSRRMSKVTDPTLEVFLPSASNSKGIGVMICPGGGYARLSYDREGTDIAKLLNGHGIAAFVLKYRLPEEASNEVPHLSPLMDAKRGMELIREHAEEWNLDTSKVGVMGFSAGGHLASTLGTHFEPENRPDFMVLLYPVITMKNDYTHNGSRVSLLGNEPSNELVEQYSNELQVTPETPPTFIVHSMDDMGVPVENSLQFAKALKDAKVPLEMHIYPYGGHGFSLAFRYDRLNQWPLLLVDWIEDVVE